MPKKFIPQNTELLPPLTYGQVANLIKFCRINSDILEELHDFESCCASDDGAVFKVYVYDSLRVGYGLTSVDEYNDDQGWNDDEDEDEDDDDE